MTGQELIKPDDSGGPLSAVQVRGQINLIQELMRDAMTEGEHFGCPIHAREFADTGKPCKCKKVLYKAGAEKLCLLFRLDPQFETSEKYEGVHFTVNSKCTLYHITSGKRMGSGMGMCTTKESKYAYRQGSRKCPNCGKEAIIKGREEYGGGWLCFEKKGGCGSKWAVGEKAIESQQIGRVPNEDLPDCYNTVLKISNKRSLVAASLMTMAASDIFSQDLEDLPLVVPDDAPPVPKESQARKPKPTPNPPAPKPPPPPPAKGDVPSPPNVGETARLPGHGCEKCGNEEWIVRAGSAKSKNPGRVYLACSTKDCKSDNGYASFGGWWDEVMAQYEQKAEV